MLKTVLHDKRVEIYQNLAKLCETPAGALKFAELAGDRLEGKPTQRHEHRAARQTIFQKDPTPLPAAGPPALNAGSAAAAAMPDSVLVAEDGQTFLPVRDRL